MQNIRIVKKYISTDGMEFLSMDSAQEYQLKLDSIGESLVVGMDVKFFDKTMQGSFIQQGVINAINPPLIEMAVGKSTTQDCYIPNTVIIPLNNI
jgi:hypothetical protein